MAIRPFLAMTGLEMEKSPVLPDRCAWMACHFSPYGRGLSNLPRRLPEGAILMVDDITPIHGHNPEVIARQLSECVESFHCPAVLLDFQREGYPQVRDLARHLLETLPCPVGVSAPYAAGLDSPVFLPPIPCHMLPEEAAAPWQGRELWMDWSMEAEIITVTADGASTAPLPCPDRTQAGFQEEALHCHYIIQELPDALQFTLWRTWEDWAALAACMGISTTLMLHQEFAKIVGEGLEPPET